MNHHFSYFAEELKYPNTEHTQRDEEINEKQSVYSKKVGVNSDFFFLTITVFNLVGRLQRKSTSLHTDHPRHFAQLKI